MSRLLVVLLAIGLAVLPTAAQGPKGQFDGTWRLNWTTHGGACRPHGSFSTVMRITRGVIKGRVKGGPLRGEVTDTGIATWSIPALSDGVPVHFTGTFRGDIGSGTFARERCCCTGVFTAKRI